MPPPPIPTHPTIAGIRPFAELARGAAAVVYKGYDPERGVVLLKVLTAEAAEDPALVAWFEGEAAAVAAVAHPNVVALHASGREDGRPYLVMEFVEGLSLGAALGEHGAFPPELAAYVAAETAKGLEAAHAAGVLHRDLKPDNILLGVDGAVKLTDFGLATRIDARGAADVRGTPGYLAPETVRGASAGPQADLFALGATLAEMLTGRKAFPSASASEALHAALHHDPLPPLRADPRFPAGLVDEVQRLLARDAALRPGEAGAEARALAAYARIEGTGHDADAEALARFLADPEAYRAARPAVPTLLVGMTPPPAAPDGAAERAPRPLPVVPARRRRPVGRWVGGVLLVLSVTAALALATIRTDRTDLPEGLSTEDLGTEGRTERPAMPGGVPDDKEADSLLAAGQPSEDSEDPADEPALEPEADPDDPEIRDDEPAAASESDPTGARPPPVAPAAEAPLTGRLIVNVDPWAHVYVDGRSIGEGRLADAGEVPAGPHRIVLRRPDFPEYTATVTVEPGETEEVSVSLWSLVERVTLQIHPFAEVFVDGRSEGTFRERRALLLTPGAHTLRLVHPSLGSHTVPLTATAGRERTLSYNLLEILSPPNIP